MSKVEEFLYRYLPNNRKNDFFALKEDERELLAALHELSLHDVAVNNSFNLWFSGHLSFEKMLLSLTIYQSKEKRRLQKMTQYAVQNSPVPITFPESMFEDS